MSVPQDDVSVDKLNWQVLQRVGKSNVDIAIADASTIYVRVPCHPECGLLMDEELIRVRTEQRCPHIELNECQWLAHASRPLMLAVFRFSLRNL